MANNTPHIVGGGLGTFRKQAIARAEAAKKAEQEAANRDAMARVAGAK